MRFDLNFLPRLSGAVDVKITNYEMAKQHKCLAISGPSYENLPVFSFNKFPDAPKRGLPINWNFGW